MPAVLCVSVCKIKQSVHYYLYDNDESFAQMNRPKHMMNTFDDLFVHQVEFQN